MKFLICIAGLPREGIQFVRATSPATYTESKANLPIIREMKGEFAYRDGMSDFYLGELAKRLTDIPPEEEVGIGLAYANHPGAARFIDAFYPFAVTAPYDPFYPTTWEKHEARAKLKAVQEQLERTVDLVRGRILLMRDTLSGQKFSPLLLPLRNFRSDVLQPAVRAIFDQIGTAAADREMIRESCEAISAEHPLKRVAVQKLPPQPFFEDARHLRFKSPGSDNHGVVRSVADGHLPACLINGRVRLGAPIRTGFHYDCNYEKGGLDSAYPNCHSAAQAPSKTTHVNISPSDAIR